MKPALLLYYCNRASEYAKEWERERKREVTGPPHGQGKPGPSRWPPHIHVGTGRTRSRSRHFFDPPGEIKQIMVAFSLLLIEEPQTILHQRGVCNST